jgi:WD repeat-containing protein 26
MLRYLLDFNLFLCSLILVKKTGYCIRTFSQHQESITSCAWLPDDKRFISSAGDKNIFLWNVDGELLHKWSGVRVTDLSIAGEGKMFIAISDKKIRIFHTETKDEIW